MSREQAKQADWLWQWNEFDDDSVLLFQEWILPHTLESFRDQTVLDAGCGGGHHIRHIAGLAREVVGVDLNCGELAAERCAHLPNVSTVSGDIATVDLGRQFDCVYCIGVLHHTDDPASSFQNLARHVKSGGRLIVWVYSHEGNALNRWVVEPLKRWVYGGWPKPLLRASAVFLTALLYIPVYTLYVVPLRFLPYYDYFKNFRRLPFHRNVLNIFDKLNAPQTTFIRRANVEKWFFEGFRDVHVSSYVGVSWRASGTRL